MTTMRMPFSLPSPRSNRRCRNSRRARMPSLYTRILSSAVFVAACPRRRTAVCYFPYKIKLAPRGRHVEEMAKRCCGKGTGSARAAWDRLQSVFFIFVAGLFSISPGKNCLALGGLGAIHTLTARALLLQWNAPHGGACFFFDFRFAFRAPTPERIREAILHGLL